MKFVYDDGGRAAAGFKGKKVGDCICRAVAIATGKPYRDVHNELTAIGWLDRPYIIDVDGLIKPRADTKALLRQYMG